MRKMAWIARLFWRSCCGSAGDAEDSIRRTANGGSSSEIVTAVLPVRSDSPIQRIEDDALGRAGAARSFAEQALALDVSDGVVVGVLGLWGSGKTSFVNLARAEFERVGIPILDINPWMFSGAQQLGCFRHQLLLPRPYLVLTKPLRLDIQCQRAASVKIGWKCLDD